MNSLTGCDAAKAEWFASRLIREIRNQTVALGGKSYQVGASMGGTLVNGDATNQDEILHQADMACYRSKQRGRNSFTMHEPAAASWSSDKSLKSAG